MTTIRLHVLSFHFGPQRDDNPLWLVGWVAPSALRDAMSFWTDDVEDGWDEDEVDLSDVEIAENEDDKDDANEYDNVQAVPPTADQPTTPLGGGMFMGRLTRFIEAVTQPEDEEDDEGIEDEEEDDEEYEEQQNRTPSRSLAEKLSSYLSPSSPGWEDDESYGLDDDDDDQQGGGWDEDDDALDDLVDDDDDGMEEEDVQPQELTYGTNESIEQDTVGVVPSALSTEAAVENGLGLGGGIAQEEDDRKLISGSVTQEATDGREEATAEEDDDPSFRNNETIDDTAIDGWDDPDLESLEEVPVAEPTEAHQDDLPNETVVEELDLDGMQPEKEDDSAVGSADAENDATDTNELLDSTTDAYVGEKGFTDGGSNDGWDDPDFDIGESSLQDNTMNDDNIDNDDNDELEANQLHATEPATIKSAYEPSNIGEYPANAHTFSPDSDGARNSYGWGNGEEMEDDNGSSLMALHENPSVDAVHSLDSETKTDDTDDVPMRAVSSQRGVDGADQVLRQEGETAPAYEIDHEPDREGAEDPDEGAQQGGIPSSRSPLVDHVPALVSSTARPRGSTLAFASESGEELIDDTVGDLDHDEQDFGPVVDQLPPYNRPVSQRTASIVTQIALEELDHDDEEVGEDTEPGQTSEETPTNGVRNQPPVVDHVPLETTRTRNPLRDSTVAVASEQSSTVMENIWKEDFDPDDDDYGPVVDQLPTNPSSVRSFRSLSSVAVQASIQELDEEDEEDDDEDDAEASETDGRPSERQYGPWSGASVADSMAVIAPIAEHDEENTVELQDDVEGTDIHDDETLSHGMYGDRVMNGDKDGPLVDHVPVLPGSRPSDSATWIAYQSEVSTVGDMTYEENEYGPVVDQTPPPRPAMTVTSGDDGEGSTVVAATKADTLDMEDDQDTATLRDDGATVETVQSGNEPNLVDHVPETPARGLRRVNSSSAIAEAQSVISTRDDDYGLVVDQTPFADGRARDSTASFASPEIEVDKGGEEEEHDLSERRVEVEPLPPSTDLVRMDSVHAVKSVASEEASLLTAFDGFCPVVDHLPAFSASLPPSRGGSTTGALATLSEAVDDSVIDGDGWDFDNDTLSRKEQDPDPLQTPETKNKSVTFLSTDGQALPPSIPDIISHDETRYFDPNLGLDDSEHHDVAAFHDPESGGGGAYDEKPASIAAEGEAKACEEATSADCPCLQKVLYKDGEIRGPAVVDVTTPDGKVVPVDYNKLLQEELTKRLLLEKEVEKYKVLVESVTETSSTATSRCNDALAQVDDLKQASKSLRDKLEQESNESASLKIENDLWREKVKQLQLETVQLKEQKFSLESKQAEVDDAHAATQQAIEDANAARQSESQELLSQLELVKRESSALRLELETETNHASALKTELNEVKGSASRLEDEGKRAKEAEAEKTQAIIQLQDQIKALSAQLQQQQAEVSLLAQEKGDAEAELATTRAELGDLHNKEVEWKARETDLLNETSKLRQMVSESTNTSEIETHFTQQIDTLKKELQEKSAATEDVVSKLRDTEAQLRESEGRNLAQMKESVRLSKVHETDIAKLSDELTILAKLHEEELAARDGEDARLTEQLNNKERQLEELREENSKLVKERESRAAGKEVSGDMEQMTTEVETLRKENQDLSSAVEDRENSIARLIDELSVDRGASSHTLRRAEGAEQDVAKFVSDMEELADQVTELRKENEDLSQLVADRDNSIAKLINEWNVDREASSHTLRRAEDAESRVAKLSSDVEGMMEEGSKLRQENEDLTNVIADRESSIAKLIDDLNVNRGESIQTQQRAEDKEQELVRVSSDMEELTRLVSQLQGANEELANMVSDRDNSIARLIDELNVDREASSHTERRAEEAESAVAKLTKDVERLKVEAARVQDENARSIADDGSIQSEMSQLRADNARLALELDHNARSHEKLLEAESNVTKLTSDIQKLTTEVAQLRQDNDDIAGVVSDRDNSIARLIDELNVDREASSQTLQRAVEAESKVAELSSDLEKTIDEANKAKREQENLSGIVADRDSSIAKLIDDLNVNREESIQNQQRAEESENEYARLSSDIEKLVEEASHLRQENEDLTNIVGDRDSSIAKLIEDLNLNREESIRTLQRAEDAENELARALADYEREGDLKEMSASLKDQLARSKADYDAVAAQLKLRAEAEEKLRKDIDSLLQERDTVMQERQALEEENEEMLIQLGLNKEQMDANESEMEAFLVSFEGKEDELTQVKQNLVACEEEIRDLNAKIEELTAVQQANGHHQSDEHRRVVDELTGENAALRNEVSNLTSSLEGKTRELLDLRSRLQGMTQRAETLASANVGDKDAKGLLEIKLTESVGRCRELDELCSSQRQELASTTHDLRSVQTELSKASGEVSRLRAQISELERICAELDAAARQKDLALNEVHRQMESLRDSTQGANNEVIGNMSRHIDDLSARLQEAEYHAEQNFKQFREAEASHEAAQRELAESKARISKMEQEARDFRRAVESNKEGAARQQELERRCSQLQQMVEVREKRVKQLELEMAEASNLVGKLETDLGNERIRFDELSTSIAEKEQLVAASVADVKKLHAQMSSLSRKNRDLTQQQEAKDKKFRTEVVGLRQALERKQGRLTSLEKQLQSLSIELSSSKDLLVSKEDDLHRVSIELENIRAEQLETTQRITSQVLNSDLSKEEAESTDTMRNLIVSLSQALQKSESQRADAIERLLRERKASADSLKRLGESVKRFYSTLSCGSGSSI